MQPPGVFSVLIVAMLRDLTALHILRLEAFPLIVLEVIYSSEETLL